jgi:MFS family permease
MKPDAVTAAQPRSTVTAVVTATTIAQIASAMGAAVFPVIAPKLALELDVPTSFIGYQISIIYGTGMLATALLGGLIVRYGACRTAQASLALCAAGMLLAMTSNITAIVFASILLGIGMSVMTPASAHLLFRFSPAQHRNLIFSIKQTGVPLSWVLLALVAPGITLELGWRWALALVLATALATMIGLQPLRERWDDDRDAKATSTQSQFAGFHMLWRQVELRWMAIAAFCYSFVQLCLGGFLVTMMVEEAGYTLVEAGLLLSVTQAAGVAGRIFWGWLADLSGDGLKILFWLNVVMAVCCIATAFLTPQWSAPALILLFAVFGAAAVGWNGIFLAEVARHSPRGMVSAAIGGAMAWSFGGILVGPAAFATAYKWTGSYTGTFGWLASVAVLGLVFITAARRTAH